MEFFNDKDKAMLALTAAVLFILAVGLINRALLRRFNYRPPAFGLGKLLFAGFGNGGASQARLRPGTRLLLSLLAALAGLLLAAACGPGGPAGEPSQAAQRARMVADQIAARGVRDERVLGAMLKVPRHEFVPPGSRALAHGDFPLPITHGQTISQPYIVAYMTELLELRPGEKVLEIGTGSGYQAAVLAELTDQVFSIEIICPLEKEARALLDSLGYAKVRTSCADGYKGWAGEAPFDAILLTAAPPRVPAPLLEQLAEGGRLVAPVGGRSQEIIRIRKAAGRLTRERLLPVRFVPMTGEAQRLRRQGPEKNL